MLTIHSRSETSLRWWYAVLLVLFAAPTSLAQAQSAADAFSQIGFHPERNYFSPEPFEHYDTMSGNVILTFTDLALPGNAGRSLRFVRYQPPAPTPSSSIRRTPRPATSRSRCSVHRRKAAIQSGPGRRAP